MTDTPMLDRALDQQPSASTPPQVAAPSLPEPGSLADDVMVAAAFLQGEADRFAALVGDTPVTPGDRSNLAAAAAFRRRSERLFAHARDLARAEFR